MSVFCLLTLVGYSSPVSKADKLKQEVVKASDTKDKLQFLLLLTDAQIEEGNKEAIISAERALTLANSLRLEVEKARALNYQGVAFKIWGDNSKSILCLFEALNIYDKLKRRTDYAEVLMNIGETNRAAANLEKAMTFLKTALRIFSENYDTLGLAKTYNRMAATGYELLFDSCNGSEKLFKPLENRKYDFEKVYRSNQRFRQKYDTVLIYAYLSNHYANKPKLVAVNISTNIIVAALYTITFQYDKALFMYRNVLQAIKESNSTYELPLALYNMAVLQFKNRDYEGALVNAKESYRIAKELDIKSYILVDAGFIATVYENMGNYKEAYIYSKISYLGRIAYYQNDIDVKMKAMQSGFEFEQKKKELSTSNRQFVLLVILFSIIFILILIFITILIKKNIKSKWLNSDLEQQNQTVLRQNKQLATLNAEKDKFFSIIAHDLRGPFNGFLGLTQVMAEELHEMTLPQIQKIAVSMHNSATNLFNLLENLLEWSRMQRGLLSFRPEQVELSTLIDEGIALLIESANSKGVEISYNLTDELIVNADSNMIKTVIRNLVSNAVKFSTIGGKVLISDKVNTDGFVQICVGDSGIGMDEEMIGDIFKLDKHTSRRGTAGEPSTGLGLFLCKDFIEKHGGRITVESEVGVGSRFYFTLPMVSSS